MIYRKAIILSAVLSCIPVNLLGASGTDLKVGMTPYDVVRALGPAIEKSSNSIRNRERWSYKSQIVTFIDGKITGISTFGPRVQHHLYQPRFSPLDYSSSASQSTLPIHQRYAHESSPRLTEKVIRDIFNQVRTEEGKEGGSDSSSALPQNPLMPQPPNIGIPGMPRIPVEE